MLISDSHSLSRRVNEMIRVELSRVVARVSQDSVLSMLILELHLQDSIYLNKIEKIKSRQIRLHQMHVVHQSESSSQSGQMLSSVGSSH